MLCYKKNSIFFLENSFILGCQSPNYKIKYSKYAEDWLGFQLSNTYHSTLRSMCSREDSNQYQDPKKGPVALGSLLGNMGSSSKMDIGTMPSALLCCCYICILAFARNNFRRLAKRPYGEKYKIKV